MSRLFVGKMALVLLSVFMVGVSITGCSTPEISTPNTPPTSVATEAISTDVAKEAISADESMELVVATTGESMGLDPQQMPGFGFDVNILYEPLIVVNADGTEYLPALAESMTYSEDGKTITFKIPEGLTFPNGDVLDAAAVKASFERLKQIAFLKHLYMIIQSVEAPDPRTVVINCMMQPSAMMSVIASPLSAIMNVAVAQSLGDQAFMMTAVGYGPYKVTEWNRGNYMLLEVNPEFKTNNPLVENRGPFNLDTIRIRYIPNALTRVSELETGNVDLIFDVPVDNVARLKENPDITVLESRTTALFYAAINSTRIPDVNVRTALNLSVNRDEIVAAIGGAAIPTYGPLLPNWIGGIQAVEDKFASALSTNQEQAKILLADAGYSDTDNDGILDKDGQPLMLTMYITTSAADVETAATVMQAQFKSVGIDLQIKSVDMGMAMQAAQSGDYDLFIWSCGWSDANIFTFTFTQEVFQMMAASPNYQQLVELTGQADFNNDIKIRQAKYAEASDLVLEYVPMISLYNPTSYMAYRNEITGLKVIGEKIYFNDVTIVD